MSNVSSAIAFGYVVKGLAELYTDCDPFVGHQNHPHLDEGEYEAFWSIAEFMEAEIDIVACLSHVDLFDFFYAFCEEMLPPIFYHEPEEKWKECLLREWEIFLKDFKGDDE